MNHMFRKVRIAFSILCGIVCLLLIALWMRGYRKVDKLILHVSDGHVVEFNSGLGELAIESYSLGVVIAGPRAPFWRFVSGPADRVRKGLNKVGAILPTLCFQRRPGGFIFYMRYWIPVLATGLFAVVLGIRRPFRFSLRTLLISTTLVAVVMGLIVLANR
jgi:hypothetical protein